MGTMIAIAPASSALEMWLGVFSGTRTVGVAEPSEIAWSIATESE